MILFVRATNGQIDHIQLHRYGVNYTPTPELTSAYRTPFGVFDVVVLEDDAVWAVFEGNDPQDWSKCNDLYRFVFPDVGEEPEAEGGTLGISVEDGIGVSDRLGG